jgi:hypothetical protein
MVGLTGAMVAASLISIGPDPIAAVNASRWFFTNSLAGGPAQFEVDFGPMHGADFFVGDWNGDGTDDIAHRKGKLITLLDVPTGNVAQIAFGKPGDEVFVGDFDGDGIDTFAVRRGNVFLVKNRVASGPADVAIGFGKAGDEVYVGDFDGDGVDTFAVRRGNVHFVRNSVTTGVADVVFGYGRAGDRVQVGDWDGDGRDTFAVRRNRIVYVRNDFATGPAEVSFAFGAAADELHPGDWDGDGRDTFAVRRFDPLITPIRAAFMYPWFPFAWLQGFSPFTNYTPSLGLYNSSDEATIRTQLELAGRAHIDAFISSWWGPGHHTDDPLPMLLSTTVASDSPNPDMKWAIYYEAEGYGDPTAAEISADLDYLASRYFSHPAYLRVDGDPVVFVYSDGGDRGDMTQRWRDAETTFGSGLHTVLKVFSGYGDVAAQPDSWHYYGPAEQYVELSPYSVSISPGFWLAGQAPRLDRSPSRFRSEVQTMNDSNAAWQLITTWNEWGEGTSIEPAVEFGTAYIDILAANPPPVG